MTNLDRFTMVKYEMDTIKDFDNPGEIEKKLREPPLMQGDYCRAWLRQIENSGPSFNVAKRMLAWVSLTPSYRKLTVSEIRHAMAFKLGSRVLSGEHEYLTDIIRLIGHCKGTVEYDPTIDGVISVPDGLRDYLTSGKWEGFFEEKL